MSMELFPNVKYYAYSGVDVFTALSGGVGALYGPLHGGANEVNHIKNCILWILAFKFFHMFQLLSEIKQKVF